MSCPGEDSTSEEEAWHPNPPTTDTDPKWEDESETRQTDPEEEAEPNRRWHPRDWEAIMEGAEGLAYDDLRSDTDATVTGADGPQGPVLSLHDKATNPPPHSLRHAAHVCWGHQWTICCCWRWQSPAEMPSRCMWMRLSWTISEPEAHRWASHAMEDTLLNVL